MRFTKCPENPILSPNPANDWESLYVINPGAVYDEEAGLFKLLYRAAGNDPKHRITVGLAESTDEIHFTRLFDKPVLEPSDDGPDGGGCDDPRVFPLGGYYYTTYAARALKSTAVMCPASGSLTRTIYWNGRAARFFPKRSKTGNRRKSAVPVLRSRRIKAGCFYIMELVPMMMHIVSAPFCLIWRIRRRS